MSDGSIVKAIENMRAKRQLNSRTAKLLSDVIELERAIPDERKRKAVLSIISGLDQEANGYMEALDDISTMIANAPMDGSNGKD